MKVFVLLFSLLLIFGVSFLSSCASSSPVERQREKDDAEKEALAEEVKDELEIGRLVAAKLAGHFGMYENAKATRYLNLVGNLIAQKANKPEIQFRFGILEATEANAFAAPGGYIFLTRGLVKQLKSESELAGVLGHEITHVTEKHMYDQIKVKKGLSAGETIARAISMGRADFGVSVTKIVNGGLELLLDKGLGKDKENEADQSGMIYASVAGYNPGSFLELLKRLEKGAQSERVHKTHPPFSDRIDLLAKFMKKQGIKHSQSEPKPRMDRFHEAFKEV